MCTHCQPGVDFLSCKATGTINTKMILEWVHKQFVTTAHILFYFLHDIVNPCMVIKKPTLHWRHNDHNGVSNHQPHHCLLNRLFRRRSKKTSKLRVTGLCVGNSPGPVNSPHKGPVTRKMFPFDDVIMDLHISTVCLVKSVCVRLMKSQSILITSQYNHTTWQLRLEHLKSDI